MNDSHAAFLAGRHTLYAVACVGACQLISPLAERDTLHTNFKPGLVHHRKHVGHATVFFADEVANGSCRFTEVHDTGRTGVNTQFVFDRGRIHVVAITERTVVIYEVLGHEEH